MAKPLVAVETIYDTALRMLEEEGPTALSARNLAAALKCSTRTLYQQVGKREELIGRLIAYHLDGLQLEFHSRDNWQDSARDWAAEIRRTILAHPNLFTLMTAEHRAPIAAYVNVLLKILLRAGFDEELALRGCRVLVNVAISLSLSEIRTPPKTSLRRQRSEREIRFEDLVIARSGRDRDQFQAPPEVFANAVDWIVRGLAPEVSPAV